VIFFIHPIQLGGFLSFANFGFVEVIYSRGSAPNFLVYIIGGHLKFEWWDTLVPWLFQHMFMEYLINFEKINSTNGILLNIHDYPSLYFLIRRKYKLKISTFLKII